MHLIVLKHKAFGCGEVEVINAAGIAGDQCSVYFITTLVPWNYLVSVHLRHYASALKSTKKAHRHRITQNLHQVQTTKNVSCHVRNGIFVYQKVPISWYYKKNHAYMQLTFKQFTT